MSSHTQELVQQHASAALANYLDDGHALEEAISAFTGPVSSLVRSGAATDESTLEQPVQDLWSAIIARARTAPSSSSHQDRLVTFLTHLKSSKVPGNSNTQLWGASLWADLPMFGASMREAWNSGPSNETNILVRFISSTNRRIRQRNITVGKPQRLCRPPHCLPDRRFLPLRHLDHARRARNPSRTNQKHDIGRARPSRLRLDSTRRRVSVSV